MKRIFQELRWILMILGILASLVAFATPTSAQASATCTPKATLPADVSDPNAAFDTGAHVIASFNTARQQEGCNVPVNIDPTAYDAASPQQQMLLLVNAERQDRGLGTLQLDTTLLSQIQLNHGRELFQYNYFGCGLCAHSSPINQPNKFPWDRDLANPAIRDHSSLCCAENIAPGGTLNVPGRDSAGLAVYTFMYRDSLSSWGHRQNILGYDFLIDNTPGRYNWIGIGVATGGAPYDVFYVLDFFQDSPSSPYTPPGTADTQPPMMDVPTIKDANTVQVTNVQDNSDGSTNGVAGVTGVVFYVGTISYDSNTQKFSTVPATSAGNGTWTANLAVTDVTTLHAVAVDGSGNFTDCAGNASSCGTAAATELPFRRYFNSNTTTHWVTTGQVTSDYHFERTLGSLLSTAQANTQALYGCVATGTEDHFISTDPNCGGQTVLQREGYIYTSAPAGIRTIQLYHCHFLRPGNIHDDYVSADPNCEGFTNDGSLGFALATAFQRYFNSNTTTHWVTTSPVTSGYNFESTLGSLLSTSQSGTQALYGCVAPGTEDHFVSTDSGCRGQITLQREGYDYTAAPSGLNTVQIYACHLLRPGNIRDDYVSTDPNCEGFTNDGSLGFVLKAG